MVVVLKPEFKGKVSADDLKQFLKKFVDEGRLPKYGIPDKYVFVDAIPKTSVGKINKIELRKMYI